MHKDQTSDRSDTEQDDTTGFAFGLDSPRHVRQPRPVTLPPTDPSGEGPRPRDLFMDLSFPGCVYVRPIK